MKSMVVAMIADDSGQGLVEYSIILLLVALVGISAMTLLGNKANNSLGKSGSRLP